MTISLIFLRSYRQKPRSIAAGQQVWTGRLFWTCFGFSHHQQHSFPPLLLSTRIPLIRFLRVISASYSDFFSYPGTFRFLFFLTKRDSRSIYTMDSNSNLPRDGRPSFPNDPTTTVSTTPQSYYGGETNTSHNGESNTNPSGYTTTGQSHYNSATSYSAPLYPPPPPQPQTQTVSNYQTPYDNASAGYTNITSFQSSNPPSVSMTQRTSSVPRLTDSPRGSIVEIPLPNRPFASVGHSRSSSALSQNFTPPVGSASPYGTYHAEPSRDSFSAPTATTIQPPFPGDNSNNSAATRGGGATHLPPGARQSGMYHNLSSTDRFSSYSSTAVGISPNASESGRVGGVSMKPLPHSHSRNHSTQFLLAHGKGKGPLTPEMAAEAHAHAHGGSSRHGSEYESTEHQMKGKMFLGGLIKPPVVRQFMHNGYLYKEEEDRGISHFELFADLIFVAIVHIFGEAAAEEATLLNAIKFLLMFWPPWSIWADMRSYLNVSGTDDAIQRAYILVSSILLIGYTAQGASIKLHLPEEEGGSSSGPHEASSTLSAAIAEATSSLTETSESTGIHRRDTELGHPTITEGGYAALRAATAYFLVAKAIRISLLIFYAYSLPRFRTAHIVQAVFTLIPCLVFIRMFWVDSVIGAMGIFTLGVFLEVLGKYVAGILVHSGSTKKKRHQFFIPALEIGHVIEKTAAFFVLVTGEILIAVSYIAEEESEIGPRGEFWRSALGVVIAFLLCWIYFDADSCKVFVHAIRRHWFSSITWTQLHLPLCAGLVIAAAAVHKMILKQYIDQGLRWYFAGGMAAIMICLGIMGFLHRSLDKPGSSLIPRWIRLSLRIVLGCFFLTFPLYSNESSVMELGVYAAGLGALVLVETIGKIGTVGNLVETSIEMKGDPGAGVGAGPNVGFGPAFIAQTETLLPGGSGHGGHRDETGKSTALEYVVGSKRFKRDELTAYEKGEEDVGGENSVGLMKAVSIRRGQRTGLAAF